MGQNEDEVSGDLVKFLKYAGSELSESRNDYSAEFVRRLQKSVEKIKFDREMGRRYMLLEEIRKEEFNAGKAEGLAEGRTKMILSFLSDIANIPDNLRQRISSIRSPEQLEILEKKAARANTLEDFIKELDEMQL